MDLLDEIWSLIFGEYLDYVDTIRCRRVSKRFKFLIDHLRPSELLVYSYETDKHFNCGPVDRQPTRWIQLPESLPPNSSFQIVFGRLKFLQFGTTLHKEFNLELLNEFVQLETLYLGEVYLVKSKTLRLPKLRALSLRLQSEKERRESPSHYHLIKYEREPRLVINSKVETLIGVRSKLLVVDHPECIRHLEASRRKDGALEAKCLVRFKNIRTLHSPITEELLDSFQFFEDLEELHLYQGYPRSAETTLRLLRELLDKNAELKRDVKIYFHSIRMPGFIPKCKAVGGFSLSLEEQIRHYPNLADRLLYESYTNYGELMHSLAASRADLMRKQITFERSFPVDFWAKYPNIKRVGCSTIPDDEQLLWFLGKCTRLATLELRRKTLSQRILNGLPVVCRHLKELDIDFWSSCRSDQVPRESSLDPSPIYKLRQLFKLKILEIGRNAGPDKPFDFGLLLERCKYLVGIELDGRPSTIVEKSTTELNSYTVRIRTTETRFGMTGWYKKVRYTYEELRSSLNQIIQNSRDGQEWTGNRPIEWWP